MIDEQKIIENIIKFKEIKRSLVLRSAYLVIVFSFPYLNNTFLHKI